MFEIFSYITKLPITNIKKCSKSINDFIVNKNNF